MPKPLENPALCIALALSTGLVAQAAARHLRVPGIVILLFAGVLLGPDVAGVIRPELLGDALPMLVGFAVAVILFEGGLNLDLRRMRRESRAIRQLVTAGALVSTLGGVAVARFVMRWGWRPSVLFGTLAMVTGPTVINPLLKRLRIESTSATILETEGVLVDALGAIVATVALEVALEPSTGRAALGALEVVERLGASVVLGAAFGGLLAVLLRARGLVPEGLENVVTLSLVLVLFQGANALSPESGIGAVVIAGAVVGNAQARAARSLMEFKEQLTVMFIGVLFVLLAADVRLADVRALGRPAVITVVALVLVVRPLCVIVGTLGTGLDPKRRAFIAWIGPRGVVAAAVASFFATQLEAHGIDGGRPLRALVFLVIAVTVTLAGATGGLVARLLGVRKKSDRGWIILGANELALAVARALRDSGEEVLCIDTNPQACRAAEEAGIRAVYGNALSDLVLQRAEIDTRTGALALTPNDELNILFLRKAKQEGKLDRLYAARAPKESSPDPDVVASAGQVVAFGHATSVDAWSVKLRHGDAALERFRLPEQREGERFESPPERLLLPLVLRHRGRAQPVVETTRGQGGDEIDVLVDRARGDDARAWLRERGWEASA